MTQRHSFKYAAPDHPLFIVLAGLAARYDVPIDIHMEAIEKAAPISSRLLQACDKNPAELTPTIPAFERLLRHNPGARIVWQHIGWDNTGQMRPDLLRRLLTAHPNLYLALRVPERGTDNRGVALPNRITDPDKRILPEWRKLMEDFPDRIMLGSDEFVGPDPKPAKLAASFDTTWAILEQLPEELAARIGGENARQVYRLK